MSLTFLEVLERADPNRRRSCCCYFGCTLCTYIRVHLSPNFFTAHCALGRYGALHDITLMETILPITKVGAWSLKSARENAVYLRVVGCERRRVLTSKAVL